METILEHINKLEQAEWDYYLEPDSHSLNTPFFSYLTHTDFIKDYFRRGEKVDALNLIDLKKGQFEKANHTNSIFFLGILLYRNTKLSSSALFIKKNEERYISFPFYWFLTCLYHDFGMVYECDKSLPKKISEIDSLKQEFSIHECLLTKLRQKKINGTHKFLFENIRNYFCYRRFLHKKIDHGILAGLYLYDALVKNRIYKYWDKYKNLYWGKDLDEDYASIAAAIACHNIWFPQDDKAACDYIKFDMKSLVDPKPISFQDSPLLYLLGIVDTIDPIKAYEDSGNDELEILKNINLEFTDDYSVTFHMDDAKLEPSKLLDKSKDLEGWLNVGLEKNGNSLTITIK